ncbi:hypothetical protein M9H77_04933 [Catharanthus roseus]|uniref:Uncharacterized protein n=1 Tax=Catharanthus roseus TaxID=4058 RepID=A0ACC0CFK1_CATRO|nr:hypothetical protein M9H77_04933 [Catharanthus roseus]
MGSEAYKKRREAPQQNRLQGRGGPGPGKHTSGSSGKRSELINVFFVLAKYQKLMENAKRLHIETGPPILTDEQLMFEAASGSNKGHVYGFGSHSSSMFSVPSVSSIAGHKACIEREKRFWGYMQQALERFVSFMKSFASQCGVQLDSLPSLFPPLQPSDDDAISQPPTGPSSSSSPAPPPLSPPPLHTLYDIFAIFDI